MTRSRAAILFLLFLVALVRMSEAQAQDSALSAAVVDEVSIPSKMGSMPMTYMVGGKQYIAFTVGTPTEPASQVALALEH